MAPATWESAQMLITTTQSAYVTLAMKDSSVINVSSCSSSLSMFADPPGTDRAKETCLPHSGGSSDNNEIVRLWWVPSRLSEQLEIL